LQRKRKKEKLLEHQTFWAKCYCTSLPVREKKKGEEEKKRKKNSGLRKPQKERIQPNCFARHEKKNHQRAWKRKKYSALLTSKKATRIHFKALKKRGSALATKKSHPKI